MCSGDVSGDVNERELATKPRTACRSGRTPMGQNGQARFPGVERFVLMALYLWVIFGLFALYQSILLRQHGIDYEMHGFAEQPAQRRIATLVNF